MAYIPLFKRAKVIYAFPGHGKTPFAKQSIGPWLDLDFGFIRTAFKIEKEREKVLYKPYVRLMKMYSDEGFKILSNAPETLPLVVSVFGVGKVCMVLPSNPKYSAKKLGVTEDVASEWIKGWEDQAKACGIAIAYTDRSFDNFMRRIVY